MIPVPDQIEAGLLVCPRSGQRLWVEGTSLVAAGSGERYEYTGGVPILLLDAALRARYLEEQGAAMAIEYRRPQPRWRQFLDRWSNRPAQRSGAPEQAFHAVVASQPEGALCISVGGGPTRAHRNLVNINLDRFENVDVVADAYHLPYADGAVDAVHCEAVLEHLELPERAVAEMFRVMKPGGQLFACTPFLQAFHAYPNHFQNFTQVGHDRLFARAGFEIVSSGACVGPTFALSDLLSLYLRQYLPGRRLSRVAAKLTRLLGSLLSGVDGRLLLREDAHLLASTVFTHGRRSISAASHPAPATPKSPPTSPPAR